MYDYALTTPLDIATTAMGFTALGQSPDVSDDGRIVVFYGSQGGQPGVFASLDLGGAQRQIVRLAGRRPVENLYVDINPADGVFDGNNDGVCDAGEACEQGELGFDGTTSPKTPLFFSTFAADSRVAVAHKQLGVAGLIDDTFVVSFVGQPNATTPDQSFTAQSGLWTIRVDIVQDAGGTREKVYPPVVVLQTGDRVGSRIVTGLQIYDPIANAPTDDLGASRTQAPGDHRIGLMATTTGGNIVVRASHLDSDEDGLLDHWESTGIDYDGDGVDSNGDGTFVDLPLHLSSFGANPQRKDLFLEIDWLAVLSGPGAHSHRPTLQSLRGVEAAFAGAPVGSPPNAGIRLHAMIGEAITETSSLSLMEFERRFAGAGNDFDDVKVGANPGGTLCGAGPDDGHLGTSADRKVANCRSILGARRLAFRYILFGHDLASAVGATGAAERAGNDMLVLLSSFMSRPQIMSALAKSGCLPGEAKAVCARRRAEEGTLMHELGHTLGLWHGGNEPTNCKPNYLSIMSYFYQMPVKYPGRPLNYSAVVLPQLNENALLESQGIQGPAGQEALHSVFDFTLPTDPLDRVRRRPANAAIDYNLNGSFTDTVISNVNRWPGRCESLGYEQPRGLLNGSNDWSRLLYSPRGGQMFSEQYRKVFYALGPSGAIPEWTGDMGVMDAEGADPDNDGIFSSVDNCPDVANPPQTDGDGDGYGDACDPGTTSAPSVVITSPTNGASFTPGQAISIAATASDSDGTIDLVEFYASGELIGDDATAPYGLTWRTVIPGAYVLTAVAYDNGGASTTSAPVSISVTGSDLAITQAVAGARRWGEPLTITLIASNTGPNVASGATVADTFPSSFATVSWTCSATPGSTCPSSGSGNIAASVNLAAGGSVTFVATGTFVFGANVVANTATVAHPDPTQDQAVWNNSSTSQTPVSDVGEIVHGTRELEELASLPGPVAQTDWFRALQSPRSSYEIVVDGTSGDIGLGSGPTVERVASDGTTVLQASVAVGVGHSRALRWENTTSTAVSNQYIRVRSTSCTTGCGADDVYRLRAYETSTAIARFTNVGSQGTVIVLFNAGSSALTGRVHFWSDAGAFLHVESFSLGAKARFTLAANLIAGLEEASGSITVTSTGAYGDLVGRLRCWIL
jgi:uncharacterized repeat protein (TIGR01451 family)